MKKSFSILVFLTFASCSAIDKGKYEHFHESVNKLNQASQNILSQTETMDRESSIKKLSDGKGLKPSEHMITINGYEWEMDRPPVYLKIRKAHQQLSGLNELFLSYSNLLSEIAGSKQSDVSSMNQLASNLNSNTKKLLVTVKAEQNIKTTGLISSAALASLESFINNKREKYLDVAVRENQEYVSNFTEHMIDLVDILKSLVVKGYQDNYTKASVEWVQATNKNPQSIYLFKLNETLIVDLENLKVLREGYVELSKVHESLGKMPSSSFKSKIKVSETTIKRFQELQKTNKE